MENDRSLPVNIESLTCTDMRLSLEAIHRVAKECEKETADPGRSWLWAEVAAEIMNATKKVTQMGNETMDELYPA